MQNRIGARTHPCLKLGVVEILGDNVWSTLMRFYILCIFLALFLQSFSAVLTIGFQNVWYKTALLNKVSLFILVTNRIGLCFKNCQLFHLSAEACPDWSFHLHSDSH